MRSAYVYDACWRVEERAAYRSRIRGAAKGAKAAPGNGDASRSIGVRRLDAVF
jgi:hypothetical protein